MYETVSMEHAYCSKPYMLTVVTVVSAGRTMVAMVRLIVENYQRGCGLTKHAFDDLLFSFDVPGFASQGDYSFGDLTIRIARYELVEIDNGESDVAKCRIVLGRHQVQVRVQVLGGLVGQTVFHVLQAGF